jgi:hypothetical protein
VRAFLLVEVPGAWGSDALGARQLPHEVRRWLHELERRHRVRPLLIRRGGRRTLPEPFQAFAAWAGPDKRWVERASLDTYDDLLDLDVAAIGNGDRPGLSSYDEPLFCVCTHGRHDVCCAELGRPAWEALREAAPEHTWQVSHIGGDRYAANVLVLPDGVYYGRVGPSDAGALVAAQDRGEVLVDVLRGRTCHPFAVQAAEIALRRATGILHLDDVHLVSQRRTGPVTEALFEAGGSRHRVTVRTSQGTPRPLTCSATQPAIPLRHEVSEVEPA